ncbi:MAG: hypothetical protein RL497_1555 [Pseudomonadota bacterium]
MSSAIRLRFPGKSFQAHILNVLTVLALLIAALHGPHLWAASCSGVFPSGIASTGNSSTVTIHSGARVNSSPGNQITTKNYVTYSVENYCGSVPCTATNTTSSTATDYNTFPGGSSVYVNYAASQSFASSTNFTSLGMNTNATVNFAPGDYTIQGNFAIGGGTPASQINVSSTGTVRIFVQGNLDIGSETQINMGTGGGSTRFIYFYVRGTTVLQTSADLKAIIYSKGAVTINNSATLTGALTSESDTVMYSGSSITYSATAVSTTNFGSSCTAGGSTINSFTFDLGAGTASTCSARAITITAKDASNTTLTSYTGTVSISSSTGKGDWAKTSTAANAQGTLTPGSADSGAASYTFIGADSGDIVLNLTNTHAQSLTITVNDSTASKSTTSASLAFADNAFDIAITDTLSDDLIAGRSHLFTASMMKRDAITGNCSAASGYNVAGVKMWLTRNSADPSGTGPTATNNANNSSSVLGNSEPGSNNINLNFASGVANFRLLASDVGKYVVNIKDASNTFASAAITGSSATLIARPFGFYISSSANPAASSAAGTKYKKAGEAFSTTVTAVAWQSADDANDDGVADNHQDTNPGNNADLSNNTAVSKFSFETAAESALLGNALYLPAGGANPGLGGTTTFSGFSAGSKTNTNLTFNNVGIIELSASVSDGDYLGAGTTRTGKMLTRSGYVGRFYPSAFSLSSIVLTPACSAFTAHSYMAQPFNVTATLTALTETSATATNYTGDFVKLASDLTSSFAAVDPTAATALTSRVALSSQTYLWTNGVMAASVSAAINRAASPDGPFTNARLGWAPIDSDSVALLTAQLNLDSDLNSSNDKANLGSQNLRYGRLRLDDAFGPETAALPVIFRTEYWNGSDWLQNSDDSCSLINLSAVTYPAGAISTPANRTVAVGSGATTGTYSVFTESTTLGFTRGDAGHSFSAPGAGNTGNFAVDINLTNYAWLRYDWNGDGTADTQLPTARYTFGNYRGNDRVLFWQEVLN